MFFFDVHVKFVFLLQLLRVKKIPLRQIYCCFNLKFKASLKLRGFFLNHKETLQEVKNRYVGLITNK